MAHRRRPIMFLATSLVLGLVVATAGASAAVARWSVHNDADVTEIKAPRGGTEDQTCLRYLVGRSGWSTLIPAGEDPNTFGPLPPEAYGPVPYQVWKAPAGFPDFGAGQEVDANNDGIPDGFVFTDNAGNQFPATVVKQFTTGNRVRLRSAEPVFDVDPTSDNLYVLTATRFRVQFAAHALRPGDVLGILPSNGGSTAISLTAVNCGRHAAAAARSS